ncbi:MULTISPECIES: TetR/AcrR family transcriptional regulator [unclassified Leucobacter]|uniref:TetR/AcrR family transcriptional regulator n=1 Tax=unclassified Leucobacter TaxID=2621730 RepID=UPI00165DDE93|nr:MULTISPECIES: TetR/AcrR family transcriptional regulator [unclassified Leucobacter]MBC9926369.1 TetR/AcrR family transcriptional regulator [Leucobacter sp. cx-169]
MSARREELLDLAESLLETEGLEGFGIGALARAASIKPPSLYKHFSSAQDIEHALISRGFLELSVRLHGATPAGSGSLATPTTHFDAFASAYRSFARERPQRYRLMTERPLVRAALVPGAEQAAMSELLAFFGETEDSHDRSRAAWAAAHGMVSLELSGRFPPGADLEAAWQVIGRAF